MDKFKEVFYFLGPEAYPQTWEKCTICPPKDQSIFHFECEECEYNKRGDK